MFDDPLQLLVKHVWDFSLVYSVHLPADLGDAVHEARHLTQVQARVLIADLLYHWGFVSPPLVGTDSPKMADLLAVGAHSVPGRAVLLSRGSRC